MPRVSLLESVNQALAFELANDPNVVVFGEDVGQNGGVFRATDGLQNKFGEKRVFDTPLAEASIAGVAVGMSTQGLKPVAEIQFMGFIFPAMEQLVCHISRMRNRTRGRLTCPLVIRAPYGGGIHAPEHHSESMEALFAHVPGLKVVMPSSPSRAYGLLLAAIRDPDPVLFLEPKRIYRILKQDVEDDGSDLPLEACFVEQEGDDVTLVSWGAMMHETLEAAKKLREEGIAADVIDVATIKPLDIQTILESVEKTGRVVIVQEGPKSFGVGAEIAAQISEKGLMSLVAPVVRVAGFDTVMPLYRLEKEYMPSVERITLAVKQVLEFA